MIRSEFHFRKKIISTEHHLKITEALSKGDLNRALEWLERNWVETTEQLAEWLIKIRKIKDEFRDEKRNHSTAMMTSRKNYTVVKRPDRIMSGQSVLFHVLDANATIIILSNTDAMSLDEFAAEIGERISKISSRKLLARRFISRSLFGK
jgi:DNA-directed RNA polymerase specialized sigma24 family protein